MIRAALPEDLPLLPAVALPRGTRPHPATPPLSAAVLEEAAVQGLLWVAWRAEAGVVGFLLASLLRDELLIEALAVARDHQRRGFGRALLGQAVRQARDRGLAGLSLTTDHDRSWNAPFYAGAGFLVATGEALSPLLRHRLEQEVAYGHDPESRCAMRLAF